MMYYLYHIPGSKIGVTKNLVDRVEEQQGYKSNEYEILHESEDIHEISKLELKLQKDYGYKVDRHLYSNLFNKSKYMKVNPTEQTSTFPVPVNKLHGNLQDNIGLKWETPQGWKFEVTSDNIHWIMKNVRESMYDNNRCYIYNKAFYEAFFNPKHTNNLFQSENSLEALKTASTESSRFGLIRDWAETRGLYAKGDPITQYAKLGEEFGELGKALLNKDEEEIVDAIGDIVVVLTNLSHLSGYKIEDCIDTAYNVIAARTGRMINGTFVKDA